MSKPKWMEDDVWQMALKVFPVPETAARFAECGYMVGKAHGIKEAQALIREANKELQSLPSEVFQMIDTTLKLVEDALDLRTQVWVISNDAYQDGFRRGWDEAWVAKTKGQEPEQEDGLKQGQEAK